MPISGTTHTIELHWMKESDLAMHTDSGVAVPALCGAWVEPDPPLMAGIERGEITVRYASCTECDLLADLRTDAMTA